MRYIDVQTKDNRNPPIVKRFACIFTAVMLLVHPAPAPAAERPQRELSLQECVSIALTNATSVKKAENTVRLEGIDVLKGYGSFLPKLSSSAGYTPRSVTRSYDYKVQQANSKVETESVEASLTSSLNIFNGLSDYASLQSAIDLHGAAGYSLQRAREAVAYDVTQNYYQVLLDTELLEIARENLKSAQDLLTLIDRQFTIGLKAITDLYQQQADVATNALTVIRADNQLRKSKLDLLRRLRIDPLTDIRLRPVDTASMESLPPSPDLDSLVAQTLRSRADLKASGMQSDAYDWQVKSAAGDRLPKLDLSFTIGTDAIDEAKTNGQSLDLPSLETQIDNGTDYAVRLDLSWTIFDGFLTRYNVETARVTAMNQRLDYEDLKDGAVLDIQQVAGDYRAAFIQIDAARASLKASSSAFDGVKRKYELGAANFVELSTARTDLFRAKSGMTQASYNLALQKALLDFTSGKPIAY